MPSTYTPEPSSQLRHDRQKNAGKITSSLSTQDRLKIDGVIY